MFIGLSVFITFCTLYVLLLLGPSHQVLTRLYEVENSLSFCLGGSRSNSGDIQVESTRYCALSTSQPSSVTTSTPTFNSRQSRSTSERRRTNSTGQTNRSFSNSNIRPIVEPQNNNVGQVPVSKSPQVNTDRLNIKF